MTAPPINLTELRARAEMKDPIYNSTLTWVKFTVPEALALLDAIEAARELAEALDDAIKANVNDNAGWTQADYDKWDAARRHGEEALRRFQP
jgi:hypothetical protein